MKRIDVLHFIPTLIAMVGERLPEGPERDEFEAMSHDDIVKLANAGPKNPQWLRFMTALAPEDRDELGEAFLAAVTPKVH